jgi:hypothetical protein
VFGALRENVAAELYRILVEEGMLVSTVDNYFM